MSQGFVTIVVLLVLGFPLLGSLINAAFGSAKRRGLVNIVGTTSIGAAFGVSVIAFIVMLTAASSHRAVTVTLWNWYVVGGSLSVAFQATVDQLSIIMLLVVTGVGFLIHVYSVGYMEHDEGVARFFSYMNFFVFSMLFLVLAADLVFLIIGWALVAVSSYFLIGFWYDRPSAVVAARKAFITQVIGDVALVIASFLIVTNVMNPIGTHIYSMSIPTIFRNVASFQYGGATTTWICLLLAIGAFAKSAQFPLHTWLPDAMEGPTPVSALIHAATMVTAGVYLIARFHPLFDRAPIIQGLVACVGIGTSFMAGIIALSQVDIKRVIAYSTMSQIGLMIYAVGMGAYAAGMYHLVTHAFFKALLFLGAGNVIHAMHDEQDIRVMGGLGRKLKITEKSFLIGSLALSGIPLFAGWFSKENLLGYGILNGPGHFALILYIIGVCINVLTGLYAFRLWALVFKGEPQTARPSAAHEAPKIMLFPVVTLAVLSAIAGIFLWWPITFGPVRVQDFAQFLSPVFTSITSGPLAHEPSAATGWIGMLVGTAMSLIGVGAALRLWLHRDPDAETVANRIPRFLTQLSLHKFYFDELYDAILVRPLRAFAMWCRKLIEPDIMDGWVEGVGIGVDDLGNTLQPFQSGLIRDYIAYMVFFAVLFVIIIVGVVVR